MNPLKSLMALGVALALSQAAFAGKKNANGFDSKSDKSQKVGDNSKVPDATATAVKAEGKGAPEHPLNAISAALAKNSDAPKDVGARFAQYLAEDHYVKESYLAKAKEQQVKALENLEHAVQTNVEKAKPDELAALYIMIGPGDRKPGWLDDKLFKGLSSQAARGGTWPTRFERGMACWREGSTDGVNCKENEKPFAGTAGDDTGLENWTGAITQKALAVAREVVTNDALGEKQIEESIGNNDEGVLGIGDGKDHQVGFSVGDFGPEDLYESGAVHNCVVVDDKNNHCRKMSMKMTYNRDPSGQLYEALTICDVTLPGVRGGTGCETVDLADSKDIMLAGGQWHVGFSQSYEGGGLSIELSLKNDPSVKMTTSVSGLRQELAKQAQAWADEGKCRARIGAQNYVCVPFAHTLMTDDGGGNPVEVARGGLLYYPATADFKLMGKSPKPLFTADNTQSANGGTVKLAPPNTVLGCAGFPVGGDGELGKKAKFCNGGADSNDFMYLMQNDEGIYVAVTCPEAAKIYQNVTCKFPVPPVKKEVATTPGKGGGDSSGGTKDSTDTTKTDQPPAKTDPNADKVWFCDADAIKKNNFYPGFSPIGVGEHWVVYARSGGKDLANADRLCLNGLDMIAFSGIIAPGGISPSNGDLEHGVKDSDGHNYVGITLYSTGKTFVSYEHRSPDKGAHGAVVRTDAKDGKPSFNWQDGDWTAPIVQAMTYYVSSDKFSHEFLSKVDPGNIPAIDKVVDIEFVQVDRLKETSAEPEEMTVHFPKGFDAGKAFAMIKDGFSLGPAQKRKQFQSEEDLGQLQRGLSAAFEGRKGGLTAATVRLMWDKECGPAQTVIPALTIDGDTENILVYDCATGGKFETQREYDQAHQPKNKS